MNVTVRAGGWARRYLEGSEKILQADGEVTAIDAAVLAGIPREEIGMIALNKIAINPEQLLRDKDNILVYPVIIGG